MDGDKGNWLPENFHLHLTALELGALVGTLMAYKGANPVAVAEFQVMTQDRESPVPMVDRLLEKIEEARKSPSPP